MVSHLKIFSILMETTREESSSLALSVVNCSSSALPSRLLLNSANLQPLMLHRFILREASQMKLSSLRNSPEI